MKHPKLARLSACFTAAMKSLAPHTCAPDAGPSCWTRGPAPRQTCRLPVSSQRRQPGGTRGKDGPPRAARGRAAVCVPGCRLHPSTSSPTPLAHSQGHASAPQGLTAPRGTFTLHMLGERWTRGEEGRKAGRRGPGFPVLSSAPLGGQAPAARPLPDSTRPLALPAASQKRGSAGSAGLPGGLAAQAVSQRVPTASA